MIKKITNIIIQLSIIFILTCPNLTFAAWQRPQEILSGTWGTAAGQFSPVEGSLCDCDFFVDKNGMILIPDGTNKRVAVYSADGKLINYIYKPALLPALDNAGVWPHNFALYLGGNSFASDCEYKKLVDGKISTKTCFIDYNGNILGKIDSSEMFPCATGFIGKKNNIYTSYDPSGNIIKTNIQWEPEIRDANNNFYIIEESSDTDTNNNSITTYRITRYNQCGKKITTFALPKSLYEPMPSETVYEPTWDAPPVVEYGSPILAPNGDVYTWKRTPDKYSIIKWTWKDDPNAPKCPDTSAKKKK